jgi:hypothetical protein
VGTLGDRFYVLQTGHQFLYICLNLPDIDSSLLGTF